MSEDERLMDFTSEQPLFTTQIQQVNDQNAEYPVSVMKHFYKDHIIFQYLLGNTIEDQRLSDVKFEALKVESETSQLLGSFGTAEGVNIDYSGQAYMYIVISRSEQDPYLSCKINHSLNLKITEIDTETQETFGDYEEDYSLETVNLRIGDYISQQFLPSG